MKKKIAVLGTATSTLNQAPVNDPSWEIWACAPGIIGKILPRSEGVNGFDAFFEIHWRNQFYPDEEKIFLPWLKDSGKPVYVFDDLGLPNQVFYPKAAMETQHGTAFFTSTVAWMLALAIDRRPDAIGIWGVDMADDSEYAYQKQGCLHFIALARLLGINIHIPPASELLVVPKPYPDRHAGEVATTLRRKLDAATADMAELEKALTATDSHRRSLENAMNQRRGEIDSLRSLQRVLI